MSSTDTSSRPAPKPDRYFHLVASLILIALALTGFHHFYFEGRSYPGRPITPPIRSLVIVHGTAMAVWLILFLLQPILIVTGNKKLHRKMGVLASVCAAAIIAIGIKLGVMSAAVKPPGMINNHLDPVQFMAIPVLSMILFTAFITAGLVQRNKPAWHKPLMLAATLASMSAAIARIDFISNLYNTTILGFLFGPFLGTAVLAYVFTAIKSLLTGSLDRPMAISSTILTASLLFIIHFATTGAWVAIGHTLIGILG